MAIEDDLEALATKPKRVSNDLGSVEMRDGDDALKLAQAVAATRAASLPGFGMYRQKMIRPGCVSDNIREET